MEFTTPTLHRDRLGILGWTYGGVGYTWIDARETVGAVSVPGGSAASTAEQRNAIEAVASDMAAGFRNAVEKACPQAAQVYDLFHVVAKYSREVVDVVRLEEAKKQDEAGRKLIKGSRYLLLKNAPNLIGSQRKALRELLAANENLNTVYVLKDQLKRI